MGSSVFSVEINKAQLSPPQKINHNFIERRQKHHGLAQIVVKRPLKFSL